LEIQVLASLRVDRVRSGQSFARDLRVGSGGITENGPVDISCEYCTATRHNVSSHNSCTTHRHTHATDSLCTQYKHFCFHELTRSIFWLRCNT